MRTPHLTIAYITGRRVPRWQWFVDSLYRQTTAEERATIQLIFVDGWVWHAGTMGIKFDTDDTEILLNDPEGHHGPRRAELAAIVAERFNYLHIPPKPNLYQGPFRETQKNWFAAANTRNTAIIAAKNDYLVCVDDLSVLMPGWFNQVRHAAQTGYVVCGAYKKVKQLEVKDGQVVFMDPFPPGVDSRWNHGSDTGIVPWHGSGMFGCSFGVPLELALAVDGCEPACNGIGAEDYDFGIRLERAGGKFFYNRNMLTLESEEDHHTEASLPRESRLVTADRLPPGYVGSPMSDHVLLNRLRSETGRTLPLFPEGLRAMRANFLATGLVPIPRGPLTDWRDGTPLKEL